MHIGVTGNLKKELNSVVYRDINEKYNFLACHIVPPTGGKVKFYVSFDGINYDTFQLRNTELDTYTNECTETADFIGSIAGARRLKFVTTEDGTEDGTLLGTLINQVATIESIEFGNPPHRFGFTPIHKDAQFTTTQTETSVWAPETGKKVCVTDLDIIVGGTTDGTISIFNGAGDTTGNRLFYGVIDVSNNKNFVYSKNFKTPFIGTTDGVIKITTSAAMSVSIILHGYEF